MEIERESVCVCVCGGGGTERYSHQDLNITQQNPQKSRTAPLRKFNEDHYTGPRERQDLFGAAVRGVLSIFNCRRSQGILVARCIGTDRDTLTTWESAEALRRPISVSTLPEFRRLSTSKSDTVYKSVSYELFVSYSVLMSMVIYLYIYI